MGWTPWLPAFDRMTNGKAPELRRYHGWSHPHRQRGQVWYTDGNLITVCPAVPGL